MTLVYWSQLSSVVLCVQNRDFSIRNTGLYGSQPSFVAFACKTASLGLELQVSTGRTTHLWFCAFTTASLASELLVPIGPSLRLLICECKTACLVPE